MAITKSYTLGPEPFWTIINKQGTVAGGAKMYTKSSLNFEQDKIVYRDVGGTVPWPNPIVFDLNGVQGPFYWEFDSAFPNELYYIRVTDADDNPLWDLNFFSPGQGGGGGTTIITNVFPLTNYIANNQFIDHIDDITGSIGPASSLPTNLVIAPSNHKGFTPALINPEVKQYGILGPDIRFLKDSTANGDSITFPLFTFSDFPLQPDVTPVDYVKYVCTTNNPGEQYKLFQFPITQKVKNLAGQSMTFRIWVASGSGTPTLTAYSLQYFGSGTAASAEVREKIDDIPLTTTWTKWNLNVDIPDIAGKSLGTAGQQTDDDALYIQLWIPLNTPCDIRFTKPALYLGDIPLLQEFEDYDQINAINSTPRTGDIKTSLSPYAPMGWVAMDDGSIGNVGSAATNRKNQDTFQLYSTIYTSVLDTWAPVSTGRTPPGNTMAAAVADFVANKPLTLPRSLGRAMAGAGSGAGLTATVLGQYQGVETITLSGANLPLGTPFNATGSGFSAVNTTGGTPTNVPANNTNPYTQGSGTPFSNFQPTSYFNVFIKL